jgi:NTP pyrophosphatase (non-canonical NTP hydrolase)
MKSFEDIQREIGTWARINFGDNVSKDPNSITYGHPLDALCPLLGMVGELGELAQNDLRPLQGRPKLDAVGQKEARADALADILVFMCDYATREGINLQFVLNEVWEKVSKRRQQTYEADKAKEKAGTV